MSETTERSLRPGDLAIRCGAVGSLVLVRLSGALDLATADDLAAVLDKQLRTGRDIVLDCTGLDFMAVVGMSLMLDTHRAAAARELKLIVVTGGNRAVLRPLRVTRVDATLRLATTIDDACGLIPGPRG
ncbi:MULTISPECIES: STAS domain-containing protein [Amycolatopsis]|uniref:STAS domain-containing protein n=1 Tax=Amycolatopsis dendrobii TaxID=2760662 RepID=A0A7W3W1C1_9PSEU|nr:MULTISPECIES: STAS domain-containing protein [Amycolatopsis]MBB1156940.1 STAS domain-containing protein [Amycolatopsis dendrobii]UKD53642.1 STAS domain-containing protein [Amycolatopsis sp. FU40]